MKKVLTLLLILAMVLALAACGTSAGNSGDAQPEQSETANSQNSAEPSQVTEAEHYPVTITTYNYDKEPVEVTFNACPQRVICTNQSQTEMMLYFGLDQYIAGVSYLDGEIREDLQNQYNQLVADGKELTVVGYPDLETVLSLEPDLIFGWRSAFADTALGDVSEWADRGVGTMLLRCSNNTAEDLSIQSVLADFADLGAVFNIEDQTDAYIVQAQEMLDEIDTNVTALGEDQVLNVLILEYEDGMWYGWPSTCLSGSLVEAAGAKNLLTEGADLSVEDVISLNPDAIVVDFFEGQYGDDYSEEEAAAAAVATLTSEAALAEVPAVANQKIMGINLTDIYAGGIRIVPAVESMYQFFYGED